MTTFMNMLRIFVSRKKDKIPNRIWSMVEMNSCGANALSWTIFSPSSVVPNGILKSARIRKTVITDKNRNITTAICAYIDL